MPFAGCSVDRGGDIGKKSRSLSDLSTGWGVKKVKYSLEVKKLDARQVID
jgi:hypothetical protein